MGYRRKARNCYDIHHHRIWDQLWIQEIRTRKGAAVRYLPQPGVGRGIPRTGRASIVFLQITNPSEHAVVEEQQKHGRPTLSQSSHGSAARGISLHRRDGKKKAKKTAN